jgi:diguanylate cyclase (GGDEF)-like protein
MVGSAGTNELERVAKQQTLIVVRAARLRWGSVALSLVMWQLTQYPPPISKDGVLWLTVALAVYNAPLMFAGQVSPRVAKVMAVASVVGDFLVCTGWLMLTVNDVTATTYVIYMIVAAEAGLLFRWKGTIAFIAAFVPTFAIFYVFRSVVFNFPYHLENHAFRTGIVCLLAIIIGSLTNSSAVLLEEVEKLSMTDELTGLGNRRAFDQRLAQEVQRAKRYGLPLSLALLDVDHFKVCNDTHGHLAGDAILRRLGGALGERMVRGTDVAYRYGGEEFAIIMPETGDAEATAAVARIHAAVKSEALQLGDVERPRWLTISVGVTSIRGGDATAAAMVDHADQALYEAKELGRDRTVTFDPARPSVQSAMRSLTAAAGS